MIINDRKLQDTQSEFVTVTTQKMLRFRFDKRHLPNALEQNEVNGNDLRKKTPTSGDYIIERNELVP